MEDGEAHYLWCIKEIRSGWEELPAINAADDPPAYPFTYSEEELENIEKNTEAMQKAMDAMVDLKERMGSDLPDRGAVMPDQHSWIVARLKDLRKDSLRSMDSI